MGIHPQLANVDLAVYGDLAVGRVVILNNPPAILGWCCPMTRWRAAGRRGSTRPRCSGVSYICKQNLKVVHHTCYNNFEGLPGAFNMGYRFNQHRPTERTASVWPSSLATSFRVATSHMRAVKQGLTLIHFSAQLKHVL